MFNDDDSVQYREFVIGLIKMSEDRRKSVSETLTRIERISARTQSDDLQKEKQSCLEELREIDGFLARLVGRGP